MRAMCLWVALIFATGCGGATYRYTSERGMRCYVDCKGNHTRCQQRCHYDTESELMCVHRCDKEQESCWEDCPDVVKK